MATSMCRVCLETDTKMTTTDSLHLLEMYETLTNTKLHMEEEPGMPRALCYLCYRHLQKCYTFTLMAHKSNRILQDLLQYLQYRNEATLNTVTVPPRDLYNLSISPIRHMSLNIHSDTSTPETVKLEHAAETDETGEIVLEDIKSEAFDEDVHVEEASGTIEIDLDMKLEPCDEDVQVNFLNNTELSLENDCNVMINTIKDTNFHCVMCNMKFETELQLVEHVKTHKERPFSCNICFRTFINKGNFTRHMQMHAVENTYHCKICNKTFRNKRNFRRHMLIHAEKQYSCDTCNKTFSQKCILKSHMRIHSGEKLYSCDICEMAFIRKHSVKRHMQVHVGEKLYSCNTCKSLSQIKPVKCESDS